jgi:membrane-associated protein
MTLVWKFIDLFLHLDKHLDDMAATFGPWLYVLVFAVIFCETGLVFAPILPGDSLLFAFGMLIAREGSQLNLGLAIGLLLFAAIAGDAVNYWVGYYLGPKVFQFEDSWLLNKKHLIRTHEFYERHGGKTIVLARFVPIVRTFAPFVAGIARMGYFRFWQFNCIGGVSWVLAFLVGGYLFGNIPAVRSNFHYVIVAILVVSVLPMGIEWLLARQRAARPKTSAIPAETASEVEAEL